MYCTVLLEISGDRLTTTPPEIISKQLQIKKYIILRSEV